MRRTANLLIVLLLGLGLSNVTFGQVITGSLVGRVTDPSGAVVAGTLITVTNEGTGISIQTTTSESGVYSVPNLFAGRYKVQAVQTGFGTIQVVGIRVLASETVRQDLVLKVGEIREQVTVNGQDALIHTDTQTISGSLTTQQISDLPFSKQSIEDLLGLMPGAQLNGSPDHPQSGGATWWGSNNFTLNGSSINDFANGSAPYGRVEDMISMAPLSSLQEFRVSNIDNSAQYRAVGVVDLVTKQGTNQFYGGLYEYNQNRSLAANEFVLNAIGQPKPQLNLNQFGGNVGGPVKRNKLWFFFNYSGFRRREIDVARVNLPSMAMRQGDFSALCSSFDANGACNDPSGTQLYNPFTGNPFPKNQIPQSMITSQAKTLLGFVPPVSSSSLGLPSGAPNITGQFSGVHERNIEDSRVDYQISARDSLFGAFERSTPGNTNSFAGSVPQYGNRSKVVDKLFSYSLTETHTFTPKTLNTLRASWGDHPDADFGQNLNFDPRSLFQQLTPGLNRGLPSMSMLGYFNIGGDGSSFGSKLLEHTTQTGLSDDFVHIHGNHTIKVGVDINFEKQTIPASAGSLGAFNFNGVWTGNKGWPGQPQSQGNAFADFLLGVANSSVTGTPGNPWSWSSRIFEWYAQDSWQASGRLTFNYGVRYFYQSPWTYLNNRRTIFDGQRNKLALPQNTDVPVFPGLPFANEDVFNFWLNQGKLETTKAIGLPLQPIQPDKNNWAPRIGLAYRPFSGNKTVIRAGWGLYYNIQPSNVGSRDDYLNPPWQIGGGYSNFISNLPGNPTSPFLPDITFANPFPSPNMTGKAPVSIHPTLFAFQQNFENAEIQQWNLTLEQQFSSNWMGRVSYVGTQSHHLPWFFSDINVPVTQTPNATIQDQRQFQPWGAILSTRSGASQNYNSLQLEGIKSFSSGSQLQAEYAWTRSLDNVNNVLGPQNPHFPALDYGNSAFVSRHRLAFNYSYELPLGKKRRWLSNLGGIGEGVLGGWQVSGITIYQTGQPFSVYFSVPSNFVGWWGGRADRVSGAPLYVGKQTASHDIINGVQWFNPNAFAPPQPWTWGNSSRNSVWGPGFWNWDMSVQKNFRMPAEKGQLQFRASFFDAFNHFNLSGGVGNYIADTRDGSTAYASTGKIFGGAGRRIIELGLRYTF